MIFLKTSKYQDHTFRSHVATNPDHLFAVSALGFGTHAVRALRLPRRKRKGNFAPGHSIILIFGTRHYLILPLLLDTL